MKRSVILLLLFFQLSNLFSQQYEIIIKGGHVIDPKNNIDEVMDIAIAGGRILKLARHIDTNNVHQVIHAEGMYVVPGLIDMHTHVFYGADPERHFCKGSESLVPDSFAFRSGATTVVDAGSSGWKDFPEFKKRVIDSSKTRVFAFLNIVGAGMRGKTFEQDTSDMDGNKTALVATTYRHDIVGIKLAHYEGPSWRPVNEAIEAGNIANIPVMIDFGENNPPLSLEELFLRQMRPGDIFTHCFALLNGREAIIDTATNRLKPFVWEAKKRGIRFDAGYGEISFSFSQAIPAIKEHFFPNTISTDKHSARKHEMKNMLDIMSEFLALGMNMHDIIEAVTWNPAKEINHRELGNLSKGSIADITILYIRNDKAVYRDQSGYKVTASKTFECNTTFKSGSIVYH